MQVEDERLLKEVSRHFPIPVYSRAAEREEKDRELFERFLKDVKEQAERFLRRHAATCGKERDGETVDEVTTFLTFSLHIFFFFCFFGW